MKDMNGQTILLISDMRQVYLAEILTKKGMSVRCLDIRNSQTVEEQLLKLKNKKVLPFQKHSNFFHNAMSCKSNLTHELQNSIVLDAHLHMIPTIAIEFWF